MMKARTYSLPPMPVRSGDRALSTSEQAAEQFDYTERVLRRVFTTAQYNIGTAAARALLQEIIDELEEHYAEG